MITNFLWKIHRSKHERFLKKRNVHLEGEHNKRFSRMPKWTRMFVWLDKKSNLWNTGVIWMGKQTLSLSVAWPQSLMFECPHGCVLWLILHEFLIIMICVVWKWFGHSLISEPFAKKISWHTPCPAICKPVEPNVDFIGHNPNLGWKFPTLP